MKNTKSYLLTIVISVLLSWVVLRGAIAKESLANQHQMSVYYVDLQSSSDLQFMFYEAEIDRMREEFRASRDLLVYLSLRFSNYEEEIVFDIFEPNTNITCFVIPNNEGSNIVKLNSCIIGQ